MYAIRSYYESAQNAHQYGPVGRVVIARYFSYVFPLYHAKKTSITYAYATMRPVARVTFAMFSRCLIVMKSSSPYALRIGIASA